MLMISARDDVVALFAVALLGAALVYGGVIGMATGMAPGLPAGTLSAVAAGGAMAGATAPLVLGPFRGIVAAGAIAFSAAFIGPSPAAADAAGPRTESPCAAVPAGGSPRPLARV